jgi:hypothetical protein
MEVSKKLLPDSVMEEVDQALKISLGLNEE